ncbi:hypothetical protein HFO98_05065 [Rhizobium leguminosarum]|uniref:hypothetical protein n=1 Tax=Rhizobium leguminosarum TaxID=384 RepID=UPI001C975F2F|nr:hypothetical protein [Rhizobium leguminosarum]MBY5407853.1 hypothetical protein [Rhizobium leguminosarum]
MKIETSFFLSWDEKESPELPDRCCAISDKHLVSLIGRPLPKPQNARKMPGTGWGSSKGIAEGDRIGLGTTIRQKSFLRDAALH